MKLIKIIGLSLLGLAACGDEDVEEYQCFSFDERQCAGDPWATQGSDLEETLEKLEDYLEAQDIEVDEVQADPDFHQNVCEACVVCPTGVRFYIQTDLANEDKLLQLDLLNFERANCDIIF